MIDILAALAASMAVAGPSVTSHTGTPTIGVSAEAMSDDVVVYGTPEPSHVEVITAVIKSPPVDPRNLIVERGSESLRRQRDKHRADVASGDLDAEMRQARELIRR